MPDQLKERVRRRLSAAERAVENGRPRAALPHFDAAIALDPLCAYGLFFRAGARLLLGDARGADEDWRALEALPASTLVRYRELEIPSPFLYPSLPGRLKRLLKARPSAFGLTARAFLLRAQGRLEDSIAAMEEAVRLAPRQAALRAILARLRFVNRFPREGLRDLEKAAVLDPGCGWIQGWLSEALRQRGLLREALGRARRAVALDPDYFRSYAWRGALLRQLGHPRRALRDFDKALAMDQRQSRGWTFNAPGKDFDRNRSWILNERMLAKRSLGDVAGALKDLNAAHALNSRYGWFFFSRRGSAGYAAAAAELDGFLKRRPRHAWAWAWRGWTRLETGLCAEALKDFNRALALGARGACLLTWRGRAYAGLGEPRRALADLRRAARLDPHYAPAAAWHGGLLRAAGERRRALRELDRALSLDPVCAWGLAWRGELRLSQGRPRRALADLDAALRLDSENADARLWRAQACLRLGDHAAARRETAACLRLRPMEWRAWALRSLLSQARSDAAGQRRALARALELAPPAVRQEASAGAAVPGGPARSAHRA